MITDDIEKSFKARLRNAAKEMNRRPDDIWQSQANTIQISH